MKYYAWILASLILAFPACGSDQKSSDEREKEVQRAIEEGTAKQKKMYEGMVKGVEGIEKKAEEKSK
ncbi:MAG: hypothetical protein ACREQV_10850 [Candidatus Binatia bacterium]